MVVKLVVLYPPPENVEAFEECYIDEIVPFLLGRLPGLTRCTLSKLIWAPTGEPPYHLMAEIYFPSLEALQAALPPAVFQRITAASTGPAAGVPVAFVCTEEVALPTQGAPREGGAA